MRYDVDSEGQDEIVVSELKLRRMGEEEKAELKTRLREKVGRMALAKRFPRMRFEVVSFWDWAKSSPDDHSVAR